MAGARLVVGWLLSMLFLGLGEAVADGPTVLRWKLSEGDRFHYRIEERATLGDKSRGLAETLQMDTSWTVGKAEQGIFRITVRIDKIRFAARGDVGYGPVKVEYDSSTGKAEGPGTKALNEVFRALLGSDIQMKMNPLGGVGDPKFPRSWRAFWTGTPPGNWAASSARPSRVLGLSGRWPWWQ